ncbi:hypothetical protein ABZ208_31180 [Streptomyces sp. NPDC006208]|uniref:hypothetical protein n=1 Tax=Streptomyces sp. NPDC006208 TaxID=3156734 RepID=UPI00339E2990
MGLLVGEAPALPEGLAEALGVGAGVGDAEWLGRPLEGRGVGRAFTGGGLLLARGAWEAGDSRGAAVARGRWGAPLVRSRTPPLVGCVAARSGERVFGALVAGAGGSSGDACSGLGAACGTPAECWGSSIAPAMPPSTAMVAAARLRPPYFFTRGGHCRRAAGTSAEGAGDEGMSKDSKEPGPALNRASGIVVSTAGAPPLGSLGGVMRESYAPHSGQVTAPLRVRRQGEQ